MRVNIKVVLRAVSTELAGILPDGTLRVRLHAVPERGEANAELMRFLAEHYGVPVSSIHIVMGHTSTRKVIEIASRRRMGKALRSR